MASSKDRVACLDGLRAISIAFVVLGHLAGTRGFPLHENPLSASLASLGVRVFFVISGFLITGILVGEQRETGKVRLDRFYFRRTLRIFVPYYAFLTVLVVLDRAGVVLLPSGDLIAAATYTTNYDRHAPWPLAHTWSLSVEEQFYLLWPAVVALLGARRAFVAAALVILGVPLLRSAEWQFLPAWHDGVGHRFETCADALASGCLLAGVRGWLHARPLYAAALRSRFAFVPIATMVVATIVLDGHPRAAFVVGWPVQNLGVAFAIDYCLFNQGRRGVSAFFSSRPLVAIGRMSYSIYLWQQIFLDRTSTATYAMFPVGLVGVVACATVSYYAIELGAMALRQVLEPRLFRDPSLGLIGASVAAPAPTAPSPPVPAKTA